jgi:hypothetical protein
MFAEQREQLKDRIRASEPGHVVDGVPGDIILFPAAAFDEEELPDADIEPCVIEEDGEPRVPIPRHFPQSWRGGIHLASPHHLAAIWTELPASTLRDEVKLREEKELPIPPIAEQRLEREVYR